MVSAPRISISDWYQPSDHGGRGDGLRCISALGETMGNIRLGRCDMEGCDRMQVDRSAERVHDAPEVYGSPDCSIA
jgi:hypothetical protein